MKPNGLVDAAAFTSHTDKPSRRHMIANSLTSAMLTERNVFSKSFTISAVSGPEAGTTWLATRARPGPAAAGPGDAADALRDVADRPAAIPRIDALGREGDEYVAARDEPPGLEARQQDLLGRPGIGRRLEHDQLAAPDHPGHSVGGPDDEGDVGLLRLPQGRGDADDDRVRVPPGRGG